MTKDQFNCLLSILTDRDKQHIQAVIDSRIQKEALKANTNVYSLFDLSYESAKVMQVGSFFTGGLVPPKNS